MKPNSQNPESLQPSADGREIAFDCKYFLGDRPCVWHKTSGVLCTCDHYQKVEQRLLIIKLDAMGDVLRTTALLPALADAHSGLAITWITRKESRRLLERNAYITEVFEYGPDALLQLQTRTFDRQIRLRARGWKWGSSTTLNAWVQEPIKKSCWKSSGAPGQITTMC